MAADDRAAPPLADPVPDPVPDPIPNPVDDPTVDAFPDDQAVHEPRGADEATGPGSAPSLGEVALAQRAGAIATMDLADRPAAFEDLDAAIVAELRVIEDL